MNTPSDEAGAGHLVDPQLDMQTRWCPSPAQDQQAADALIRQAATGKPDQVGNSDHGLGDVFTVQLLVNKHFGVWTTEVQVIALPGVYHSRDAAYAACQAAAATHRHLHPDVPVTASCCRHHRLATPTEPARGPGGHIWQTHWAVFEDITAAND